MKRARQHGKPFPEAAEDLRREIRDADLDVTESRRPQGTPRTSLGAELPGREEVGAAQRPR
ncbi:hypothetical protein [Streptomyces sp. NPDC059176]|uniref:hypothetical protein n=1 Tax=unclassified Streptomyces TaxID=2593676 RepID=UPI0036840CA8